MGISICFPVQLDGHLHRHLAEFDFRYNHRVGLGCSDIDRTKAAIKGIERKRLTYHQAYWPGFQISGRALPSLEAQTMSANKRVTDKN